MNLVEKPRPEDAPSNLAIAGRYIFSPVIFDMIRRVKPDKRGEIQLTDAIQFLCDEGRARDGGQTDARARSATTSATSRATSRASWSSRWPIRFTATEFRRVLERLLAKAAVSASS